MNKKFPNQILAIDLDIDLNEYIKNNEIGKVAMQINYENSKNAFDIAIKNIQQSGMAVKGCVMLGMPNQTKEDIIQTLIFLKERNVIIRPTIYTPYQMLDKHIDVEELSKYNRKTLKNDNVENVTSEQLFQLVKAPYNYDEILKLNDDIEL